MILRLVRSSLPLYGRLAMIALARAGPTPGSLSSSSAVAEFISTNSPGCSDLPVGLSVALGAATAGGLGGVAAGGLGDLGGDEVCACTGIARSMLNPMAARKCPSFMAVPPDRFQELRGGRHSTFSS